MHISQRRVYSIYHLLPSNLPLFHVDAIRHDFEFVVNNLDLYDVKEIILGGQRVEKANLLSTGKKSNYSGCVANLDVDYGNPALHVTPVSYFYDSSHSLANFTHVKPSPVVIGKRACAPFKVPNFLPVFRESAELPIWETNFKRLIYHNDVMELSINEEGKLWVWLAGLMIVLFIVSLLMIIIACIYCVMRAKSKMKPIIAKDEEQPLQLLSSAENLDDSAKPSLKRVTLRQPPHPINHNHAEAEKLSFKQDSGKDSPLPSLLSGMTAYFTAQESLTNSDHKDSDGDVDDCVNNDDSLDTTFCCIERQINDIQDVTHNDLEISKNIRPSPAPSPPRSPPPSTISTQRRKS
ncbi:hypothetical protein KIN20_020745 [Parelaphostrongylus tenuis]|uniref:Uncharacterized protein n=1 Tax=Parelaphostrongylus tenuis TaxID=148309 RepID=A0AAD5N6A4_PARTN|nr:hypothetical protein KIN20_020745 [Parelaphostrongylus tenuis]